MGDPDLYLETKLRKVRIKNGLKGYAVSLTKYINKVVALMKERLAEADTHLLPKRVVFLFV